MKSELDKINKELESYLQLKKDFEKNIVSLKREAKKLEEKIKKKSSKSTTSILDKLNKELDKINKKMTENEVALFNLEAKFTPEYRSNLTNRRKELQATIASENKSKAENQRLSQKEKLKDSERQLEKHYNQIRDKYVERIKAVVNFCKSAQKPEEREVFDNENFPLFFSAYSRSLPASSAIDLNALRIISLLKDFGNSHAYFYSNYPNEIEDNHCNRFSLTLETCNKLMELMDSRKFTHNEIAKYNSSNLILSEFTEYEYGTLLESIDTTIHDGTLRDFISSTISSTYFINEKTLKEIRDIICYEDFDRYEQLEDYDFDEVANSIQNSLKTSEWFMEKFHQLPLEVEHDLLCCFIKKVESIKYDIIPKQASFYRHLDESDKNSLQKILIKMIALNNFYEDVHIRIALTLGSHDEKFRRLKSEIFEFAEQVSDKYFYGTFFCSDREAISKTNTFINDFKSLIHHTFKGIMQNSFIYALVILFLDAMTWFVLSRSIHHGASILERNSKEAMMFSRTGIARNLETYMPIGNAIKELYKDDAVLAQQLSVEYRTTFLFKNMDLRFQKNIIRPLSYAEFNTTLCDIANDLREMRRLLVKNHDAKNSIIELDLILSPKQKKAIGCQNGKLYALWQWETFSDSLGRICISFDKNELIKQASKRFRRDAQYNAVMRVNSDGKISPLDTPWVTTDKMIVSNSDHAIDFNFHIMHKFHEMFYEWYANATQKIKRYRAISNLPVDSSTEHSDEIILSEDSNFTYDEVDFENILINDVIAKIEEDSVTISEIDSFNQKSSHGESSKPHVVEQSEIVIENGESKFLDKTKNSYFNKTIKSTEFFKTLERKFNVKVEQGKGSEIKVSRVANGGRIVRLGHHGKEVQYQATKVRQVLKKLNINIENWILEMSYDRA